jgi:hypothetical protein
MRVHGMRSRTAVSEKRAKKMETSDNGVYLEILHDIQDYVSLTKPGRVALREKYICRPAFVRSTVGTSSIHTQQLPTS